MRTPGASLERIANRLDAFVGRPVGKETMREIYECEWCYGHFIDRAECVEHEPKCHDNPASRSCETCEHHDDVVADTGKVWNTCAVGLLTSPRWVENHAIGCPKWERASWITPNAEGQGRREATYPELACSALDSDEPDEREERCDSCGETSRCLMRGLCPMCYELNGGTHD